MSFDYSQTYWKVVRKDHTHLNEKLDEVHAKEKVLKSCSNLYQEVLGTTPTCEELGRIQDLLMQMKEEKESAK